MRWLWFVFCALCLRAWHHSRNRYSSYRLRNGRPVGIGTRVLVVANQSPIQRQGYVVQVIPGPEQRFNVLVRHFGHERGPFGWSDNEVWPAPAWRRS